MRTVLLLILLAGLVQGYAMKDPTAPPEDQSSPGREDGASLKVRGIIHSRSEDGRHVIMTNDGHERADDKYRDVQVNHVITREGRRIDVYPQIKQPSKGNDAQKP